MRALVARAVRAAGHEIVAEVADADAAVAALARESPDALVLDGRLPPGPIAGLIVSLHAASADTGIFVLATLDERDLVRTAIRAGAHGAFLRPLKPHALAEALAAFHRGKNARGEDS
jgi:DNA-binding NarL/FixJ family response regulator